MFNPIYCSDYIKPVIRKIGFGLTILIRFFKILFTRHKELILLELDYGKRYQFDKSLLVIRYQFRNALWYDFKGIRQTTKAGIIVLDMPNIKTRPVKLAVHGFFNKKTFLIDIKPEAILQTNSFMASIIKPYNLQNQFKPIAVSKFLFKPVLLKIAMHHPFVLKPLSDFPITYPPFDQTQFI
jgi:hypothetical protein